MYFSTVKDMYDKSFVVVASLGTLWVPLNTV